MAFCVELDPVQCRFAKLAHSLARFFSPFNLVEFLARESFGRVPAAFSQRTHAGLATVLAEQSGRLRKMKPCVGAESGTAGRALVKGRQPSSEPHRPET